MGLMGVVFATILVGGLALAAQEPATLPLESEAAGALADDSQGFTALADLADRLRAALANPAGPAATRGRLALLWVRATRRALGTIPFTVDATRHEPYRTWLALRADEVIYSEPAGQWLMHAERLWALHDAHRQTPSAEPIAWETVTNGLPGECEGYPPCYLAGLDALHGEYLRRHPHGAHAADAVEQIRASCEQSVSLATGPTRREFFNPATDCVDLIPKADALRAALAVAGVDTTGAARLLAALRAICP